MSAADTALEAIRLHLGACVSVLQHLPTDKVEVESFNDNKRERPNTVPARMLFGNIKEGKEKDFTVWILLQCNHAADRSPEQRFNIFDLHGNLQAQIGADEAVRRTNAVAAFKCLKKLGVIEMDQLRAVIKYYFITKGVSTSSPWIVGAHFINQLRAACIVAREYAVKAAANSEKEKLRGSASAYDIKPSVEQPRPKDGGSVMKVKGQSAGAGSPVIKFKARRTPQQPLPHRAPTAPMIPMEQQKSPASLFIPEDPHGAASSANSALMVTLKIPAKRKASSTPPPRPIPQAAMAHRPSPAIAKDARSFLIHSDSVDGDDDETMETSRSSSTHVESTEVLSKKSPNSKSTNEFVEAYRKVDDDKERCKEKIKINKKEQVEMREVIKALQTELADLELEKGKLVEENRRLGVAKKQLRQTLPENHRTLFVFGVERASKRFKMDTRSESDSGED